MTERTPAEGEWGECSSANGGGIEQERVIRDELVSSHSLGGSVVLLLVDSCWARAYPSGEFRYSQETSVRCLFFLCCSCVSPVLRSLRNDDGLAWREKEDQAARVLSGPSGQTQSEERANRDVSPASATSMFTQMRAFSFLPLPRPCSRQRLRGTAF